MTQTRYKRSQKEIFDHYNWWEPTSLLRHVTQERVDYIETCMKKVFEAEAKKQRILEVGSGGGLICCELALRSYHATGIDPSLGALETARSQTLQRGLEELTSFDHGYAEALPYADGSFSTIVCLDVLEHVQSLQATIKEISRVLAPGGIFVFDTINRTWLARLALIWFGERFLRKYGIVPGLHDYQCFIKPKELHAVLTQNALQVHETVGFTPHIIKGRLTLAPGGFKSVSYTGYATKGYE